MLQNRYSSGAIRTFVREAIFLNFVHTISLVYVCFLLFFSIQGIQTYKQYLDRLFQVSG